MPKKSTKNLENELKRCDTLEDFLKENQDELSNAPLAEHIQNLIASKSMNIALHKFSFHDRIPAASSIYYHNSHRCQTNFL